MSETQLLIHNLLLASLFLPLASSLLLIAATRKVFFKSAGWIATAVMAVSFACSFYALLLWMGIPEDQRRPIVSAVTWIALPSFGGGGLQLGILADALAIATMPMVTGISMLVHLYSVGYMEGDKRFNWFFSYLSLFTFSMLGIVVASSIIMLFIFWELVGLTSYLLIGFWFEKRGPQLACKKAFVMNRVGDAGFLTGFGILFYQLGGKLLLPAATTGDASTANMFAAINDVLAASGHSITNPPWWLTLAGIGLFCGAIGKSAQFPLHTWLPDAMEGPTPVSSIVHSATMVAAGVYLTGRIYPILTPAAHLFIATIGLITLVMAACMALVMTDIKRVLAYSTLSQLGYMVLGLGAGAYSFALFHLITHAFFKCCLFQCSGSVIHAAHHQQDMRYYGGLFKKLPVTATCYLICTLAIAGASIPYSDIGISGFYSKDGIIAGTVSYGEALRGLLGPWANLYFLGPTIIAYLTVFYMARSFALTFLGKPRDQHVYDHAHEAPWTMLVPQACLAAMAILSVPMLMPFLNLISDSQPKVDWIQTTAAVEHGHAMHATHTFLLHGVAWVLMLVLGIVVYIPGMAISSKVAALPGVNLLYKWAYNKFYFDALYDVFTVGLGKTLAYICRAFDTYIVDGLVNLGGLSGKAAAWAIGLFDNQIIDGAVGGAAAVAAGSGQVLRTTQPGRIRVYVTLLFASAAFVMLMVVISVMALT